MGAQDRPPVTPRYLLTIPEAARVLGHPYTTVRDWARLGAMPVELVTINRRRFVKAAELADFLRITVDDVARASRPG
jgi:helix-turn-helix protein